MGSRRCARRAHRARGGRVGDVELIPQVASAVDEVLARAQIRAGASVLVAFSGGIDSAVLLHSLRFTARTRLRLIAAHYDHSMRDGSAADSLWVRGVCRAWRVPLVRARSSRRLRSEADARRARHRFLLRALQRSGAQVVLTAHHRDDQVETLLLRAMRGAGLTGLKGMSERRAHLCRPLLHVSRAEIAAYARVAGIRYREDVSNLDTRFARNRVRHVLVPRLEAAAPGITDALVRAASAAAGREERLRTLVRQARNDVGIERRGDSFELARERLLAYPEPIRGLLLRSIFRRLGCALDRAGTRAAVQFISTGPSGSGIALPVGIRLRREYDRILVGRPGATPPDRPLTIETAGAGCGQAVVGGKSYDVVWSFDPLVGVGAQAFDADALRFPLQVRAWRPGDRIRLPYGSKKLKKLFGERRIGVGARAQVPVLAQADGDVVWIRGIERAAGYDPLRGRPSLYLKVTDGTE